MLLYQKNSRFIAQIARGLEAEGAMELREIGASEITESSRGLTFTANPETLFKVVYLSRLLSRVLAPLVAFPCADADELYRNARAVNWPKLFRPDQSFSIHAHVYNNPIRNTHFASLRLKDAIVDRFRTDLRRRPTVQTRDPDLGFNLRVEGEKAVVSLDVSGGALHRRGYRIRSVAAPLQETLAAAVIRKSGWNGSEPLYDPMCGSGTLLIEACLHYCRIPAGMMRKHFGFENLPDFDGERWRRIRRDADAGIRILPDGLVAGSDVSAEAVAAARINLGRIPAKGAVPLKAMDFRKLKNLEGRVIVTNPPYGIRLGRGSDMERFYGDLGMFLKRKCMGSRVVLFLGEPRFAEYLEMKPSWRLPVEAGGLDARIMGYDVYATGAQRWQPADEKAGS